jgi:molybdate transport system regulatory protein
MDLPSLSDPEKKLSIGIKFWLKSGDESILGPGDVRLLEHLQNLQNLTKAAEACHYSYKYAWKKLQDIAKKTGQPVVDAQKGGKGGGGHVKVTPWGQKLIQLFHKAQIALDNLTKTLDSELM